jgi:hypothetical protein
MSRLAEDRLTRFFEDEASDVCSADELWDRVHVNAPRRRPWLAPALAALVVAALAITLVSVFGRGDSGKPAGPKPFTPAKNAVTIQLHLDRTTAPADGTPIKGTATIYNTTGRRVAMTNYCGTGLSGGLTDGTATSGFILDCGMGTLAEGATTMRVTIVTTYRICSPHQSSSLSSPPCTSSGPPRLGPGRYRTTVVSGIRGAKIVAPPVTVTLTQPLTAPAKNAVTVQLELDHTTAVAGTPIDGTAVITNATGHAVIAPGACNGWLFVALGSSMVPAPPAAQTSMVCASRTLPVGRTIVPITVTTTFAQCVMPEGGPATAESPRCLSGNGIHAPPLPAGTYRTATSVELRNASTPDVAGGVTVIAPSVSVTLTKA